MQLYSGLVGVEVPSPMAWMQGIYGMHGMHGINGTKRGA